MRTLALLLASGALAITLLAPPPAPAADRASEAKIGSSIVLRGNDSGLRMKVKLLTVVDPAKSTNEFLQPAAGKRLVGVKLRLTNVGSRRYSDSPSNGAVVIDTQGHQYNASIFDQVEPGLGSPKIRPHDYRVGFITFEIPKRAKLRTFQFTLDSGFGPQTGEWSIRR